MKIQGNQAVPDPQPRASEQVRTPAPPQPPQDAAEISNLADAALDLKQQRIEELKRQYEAGQYSVSSADIAASLIDEHKHR